MGQFIGGVGVPDPHRLGYRKTGEIESFNFPVNRSLFSYLYSAMLVEFLAIVAHFDFCTAAYFASINDIFTCFML